MSDDPIERFVELYERWRAQPGVPETGAMTLATVGPEGRPSARVVALRAVGPDGFRFYTNYDSRKARELDARGDAALCFYWWSLGVQVRVEGTVERTTRADSEAYFATRRRGSQLAATCSRQSEPLASRAELEAAIDALEADLDGAPVPCPEGWGGYLVRPERIELWTEGEYRVHDRELYTRRDDGSWEVQRLYP